MSSRGVTLPRIGRGAAVIAGLLGLVWLTAALAWAPPLRITCDPAVPRDACMDTVRAALARGMPRFRPLIAEAHVAPGSAFPDGYGHRATVTFSLLPGPTTDVRVHYDAGGHWGGTASESETTLAAWAVVPGVALAIAGGSVWAWRRRRSR